MTHRPARDVGFAVAVIAIAAVYLVADMSVASVQMSDPVGPRAFPALVGTGLLASGVLLLWQTLRRGREPGNVPAAGATPGRPLVLLGVAGWTALYYVAFVPVGYLIATAVYVFGLLAVFHPRRWAVNTAVTLGLTLACYGTFAKFLRIAMPKGWFGF